MNTYTTAHKAKIRHLYSCLVLCLHLVSAAVPGPCEHSMTEEHLLTLRKLIINQVQNGCSINYLFTEPQNLSKACYIKAAFPHILDLLNEHFTYEKGSDNYCYTSSVKDLMYNIYSQKCIHPINEEIEENPVKFARLYTSLPREGLQKTEKVFQMYKTLMSENDKPVNWNCEDEYANNLSESTTALPTQTKGTSDCQCSCPHRFKAFMFTRSNPTESLASPYTQSGKYILRKKNEGSKALVPTVRDKAPNTTQNQTSAVSAGPDLFTGLYIQTELFTAKHSVPIHEESTTFISSITPNSMNNSSDSFVETKDNLQSVTSSSNASSSELASMPTRAFLRSWITETAKMNKNKKDKLLEITPEETKKPPVKHVDQDSLRHHQIHLHITKSLPENMFKSISKEPDCTDSGCQKGAEERSDQRFRDRVKRQLEEKDYQLLPLSIYTTFQITSACLLLLFITVFFYCKQQKIKKKEDRRINF